MERTMGQEQENLFDRIEYAQREIITDAYNEICRLSGQMYNICGHRFDGSYSVTKAFTRLARFAKVREQIEAIRSELNELGSNERWAHEADGYLGKDVQ